MTGRVIRAYGRKFIVLVDGSEFSCEIFGRLKQETGETLVAVGDVVEIVTTGSDQGGIEFVHPRRTKFSRPRKGEENFEQVLVSNVEQMVIVGSVAQPAYKPHLIDRFTVSALQGGLQPVIVVNKVDLAHRVDRDRVKAIYDSVTMPVVFTSSVSGEGCDKLREVLKNRESILVGHSGTGKSSLLNAIHPGLRLRTGDVSKATNRGTHTTTAVELFPLPGGGFVVDSPGLKVLGLWSLERDELQEYFPDFVKFLGGCKFSRCSHLHEPECAVRQAVNEGQIFSERWESYRRIYETL